MCPHNFLQAGCAAVLAQANINVNPKDNQLGQMSLPWAAMKEHEKIVELLLAQEQAKCRWQLESKTGRTPLSWAAENAHVAQAVNSKDETRQTSLTRPAEKGYEKVVQFLLAQGQNKNFNSKDIEYMYGQARKQGHEKVMQLLLAIER